MMIDEVIEVKNMKCPSCGTEVKGKVCEYCGTPDMQTKFIFLFFGFILCFPAPATYLIWKSVKLTDKVKCILIGAIWAVYFGIFILPFIAPFFMFWF